MSGAEHVGMKCDVVRHNQRSALLHSSSSPVRAHHYSVHRVLEVVSNNTCLTTCINAVGLDVEYVMECGWLTDAQCAQSLPRERPEWTLWTKNWLCMCLGSPTLRVRVRALQIGILCALHIPGRMKGHAANTKCQSDCSDVKWHCSDVDLL